jgi:hypothetical protein
VPAAVPVTFTENVQELFAAIVPPARLMTFVPAVAVIVPAPQVPVRPFGVEITRPAGSVSLNATPVSAVVVLGFVMVKLSEVEPFSGMLAAPNAFWIVGGPTTVMEALDVLPAPPSVEVTVTELFFTPPVVPVTLTETVQLALAANVPAERLTLPDPATAVAVPPQLLVKFGVDAITRPAGKLSVKAIPFNVTFVFGFWMLNVSEVVPFRGMLAAPKVLVIDGGEATVKLAEAVFPVPPFVEVTFPVVLVYCPEAAPVTVTLNWHWLFTAIVAPVSAIPVGAVIVSVPPQTVDVPFATVSPVGSVSVNATPVSGSTLAAGLVIVNVSEVVAFNEIVEGLKTLAIDGGASTWTVAVAVLPVPPSVEVTALVVLTCAPAAVPVTLTENVQEPLAAIVPPLRLIVFVPAVAVIVPAPQVPVRPFGVETTRPAGSVSLNATPVSATVVLGFVMVKLKLVEPFSGMLAAPNALVIVGGPTTVMEALDVLPVPPSVEVTCTLLFFTPAVVPCTLTTTVQLPLAAIVPALRVIEPEPAVAVTVPLQVLLSPFGVATTRPAGRLSVKATPLSATLVFGLVMVKVSDVVPFSGMVAAPNALAIDGGVTTVKLAEAVLPVPPLVEVTLPVVLVYCPEAAPVTVTLNWHWPFTAMVAPVKAIPVGAVVVSVPPQTVEVPFATVRPVGSVSVKATPVSGSTFAAGFVIVKVSDVVAFTAIVEGLNTLAIDGGASTLTLAVAVPPVPPSVEVTFPVVLVCNPAAVPVTFTENVHEPLAAIVPPLRLIEFDPATAVIVPAPQVPVRPFGVETTRPAGNVSLNATPVSATVVLGLVIVKLSEVDPFNGMLAAPKALAMVGGATTVMEALEVLPVPPLVEVTWTLLFLTPAVVPWMVTETVQLVPGASVAPLKLTDEDPATAVAVPPQLLVRLGVEATTRPAGRLSVNATPFRVRFWLVLLTVNVRLVVPFSGIVAAPNALAIVGGLMTVMFADEVLPLPASVERIWTLLV